MDILALLRKAAIGTPPLLVLVASEAANQPISSAQAADLLTKVGVPSLILFVVLKYHAKVIEDKDKEIKAAYDASAKSADAYANKVVELLRLYAPPNPAQTRISQVEINQADREVPSARRPPQ